MAIQRGNLYAVKVQLNRFLSPSQLFRPFKSEYVGLRERNEDKSSYAIPDPIVIPHIIHSKIVVENTEDDAAYLVVAGRKQSRPKARLSVDGGSTAPESAISPQRRSSVSGVEPQPSPSRRRASLANNDDGTALNAARRASTSGLESAPSNRRASVGAAVEQAQELSPTSSAARRTSINIQTAGGPGERLIKKVGQVTFSMPSEVMRVRRALTPPGRRFWRGGELCSLEGYW